MRLALPSPTLPSLPTRRRSRRTRALAAGKKAVKGGVAMKAVRGGARRTRATVALPLLSFGAFVMFLRKRLRARREGALDGSGRRAGGRLGDAATGSGGPEPGQPGDRPPVSAERLAQHRGVAQDGEGRRRGR